MARVTGIGGVFLRAQDPKALAAWYAEHLGITISEYGGANFLWDDAAPAGTGMTAWSLFPADTGYFGRESQQAMVNYRVDDLDGLVHKLAAAGAQVHPKREDYSYGRFAWCTDPEGNRFELWEPVQPEADGTQSSAE